MALSLWYTVAMLLIATALGGLQTERSSLVVLAQISGAETLDQ